MRRTKQATAFAQVIVGVASSRMARIASPTKIAAPASALFGPRAMPAAMATAPNPRSQKAVERPGAGASSWLIPTASGGLLHLDRALERLDVGAERPGSGGDEPVEEHRQHAEGAEHDAEDEERHRPRRAFRGDRPGRRVELLDEDPILGRQVVRVLLPPHPADERLRGLVRDLDRSLRRARGGDELDDGDLRQLDPVPRRDGVDPRRRDAALERPVLLVAELGDLIGLDEDGVQVRGPHERVDVGRHHVDDDRVGVLLRLVLPARRVREDRRLVAEVRVLLARHEEARRGRVRDLRLLDESRRRELDAVERGHRDDERYAGADDEHPPETAQRAHVRREARRPARQAPRTLFGRVEHGLAPPVALRGRAAARAEAIVVAYRVAAVWAGPHGHTSWEAFLMAGPPPPSRWRAITRVA